jgi:signal transduction histidine kinase
MIKLQISKENNEAQKLLDVISQNSGRLYQGTKDFIWSINPGKDNVYEIIIRVKDYADEVFYGTKINFELVGLSESLISIKQSPTAGRNIAMIFKESLSNILKHAKANSVTLSVQEKEDRVCLVLEDNGIGFEMKDYKNSFGLSNIHQRAMRSSAEIKIESIKDKGTKIILTVFTKTKEDDNTNH